MTMKLVIIPLSVLCFAALVAVEILLDHRLRRVVEGSMSSRAPRSDEAFGAAYFPATCMKAASRIRRIVGEELEIDISRALPSDRFVEDLRIDDLDSLAAVTIVTKIEKEFGITITDDEAESIITIEQLVYCGASKLDSKQCLPEQELRT